jgi:hypothetical protein
MQHTEEKAQISHQNYDKYKKFRTTWLNRAIKGEWQKLTTRQKVGFA